jgi:hypothetical protein
VHRRPFRTRAHDRALAALVVLAAWCFAAEPRPAAQSVSVPQITAAFLLNFAKFTGWPADAASADMPLMLCATDPEVAEALPIVTAGKSVGLRKVTTSRVSLEPTPKQCSVLYASGLDEKRSAALVAALRGTSVLSVGDSEGFVKSGGIIRLFVVDGNMKFAINVAAAERARLQLSSKLLALAQIVRE